MINQIYTLKHHNNIDDPTTVKATIKLHENNLTLEYQVLGDLSHYHFPKQTKQERANNLWLDTTFELFIAPVGSDEYWELNIAPSTQWNLYHFTSYKEGMKESNIISTPSIKTYVQHDKYRLTFNATVAHEHFDQALQINLCTILLDQNGVRHFYSIERREGDVDFHDRGGFSSL